MTSARLAFDQVSCVRGDRLLFEGLSFALEPGSAAIVTGPNGVGKSSLLRIAAGLLRPAMGKIHHAGGIVYLSDQSALDSPLPLVQALDFWARLDQADAHLVERSLGTMDIAALAEVPVRMLSTGQRRRAGLARVLLSGAAIWLLDEPGNGLDSAALEQLSNMIATHRRTGGIVLAAAHPPFTIAGAIALELQP